jgi:two-component system response regulator HydG
MPLQMQAKLLRVLESGEVVRLGANEAKHVDVRLISATNHDLGQLVKEGGFREDLFFRIKGAGLHIPPVRERRDDIPLLVRHYVQQFAQQMERSVPAVADDAMRHLMQYDWPGNVRELMNVLQNVVVLTEGDRIEPRHLPDEIRRGESLSGGEDGTGHWPETGGMSLDQIEKHAIRNALRVNHGNREQAAKMLGIGERTLYRKLREYGLK